jgi:hypothetical protein
MTGNCQWRSGTALLQLRADLLHRIEQAEAIGTRLIGLLAHVGAVLDMLDGLEADISRRGGDHQELADVGLELRPLPRNLHPMELAT